MSDSRKIPVTEFDDIFSADVINSLHDLVKDDVYSVDNDVPSPMEMDVTMATNPGPDTQKRSLPKEREEQQPAKKEKKDTTGTSHPGDVHTQHKLVDVTMATNPGSDTQKRSLPKKQEKKDTTGTKVLVQKLHRKFRYNKAGHPWDALTHHMRLVDTKVDKKKRVNELKPISTPPAAVPPHAVIFPAPVFGPISTPTLITIPVIPQVRAIPPTVVQPSSALPGISAPSHFYRSGGAGTIFSASDTAPGPAREHEFLQKGPARHF